MTTARFVPRNTFVWQANPHATITRSASCFIAGVAHRNRMEFLRRWHPYGGDRIGAERGIMIIPPRRHAGLAGARLEPPWRVGIEHAIQFSGRHLLQFHRRPGPPCLPFRVRVRCGPRSCRPARSSHRVSGPARRRGVCSLVCHLAFAFAAGRDLSSRAIILFEFPGQRVAGAARSLAREGLRSHRGNPRRYSVVAWRGCR